MSEGNGTGQGPGGERRRRRPRRGRPNANANSNSGGSSRRSQRDQRQGQGQGRGRGNKGNQQRRGRARRSGPSNGQGPSAQSGGRSTANDGPTPGAVRYFTGELGEFELFCACVLGLDEKGHYRPQNKDRVARRFATNEAGLNEALEDFRMTRAIVKESTFDPELAKLDIEVAPPGIDRVELARTLFDEFLEAGCGVGPFMEPGAAEDGKPAREAETEQE